MFYTFQQNNSDGYFIESLALGVSQYVIIEADSIKDAIKKFEEIGQSIDGFHDFCFCCGERWSHYEECLVGTQEPEIFGKNVFNCFVNNFEGSIFIHYFDGTLRHLKRF